MASGGDVEPFWSIYTVHQKPDVYKQLETMRIGNIKIDKTKKDVNKTNDAFANDPRRHPLLKVLSSKPFNAESPQAMSVDSLITPNEIHFVRNHLPVPKVDLENYKLEIIDETTGQKWDFDLNDIKNKFNKHTIPVTLQCSGNRRKQMTDFAKTQGLQWDKNAISTAEWTGIFLRDLLIECGVDIKSDKIKHIQFEGLDSDPTGSVYGASIPSDKVFNENGQVLLAFKMNSVDLPADFGFPLRVIVPGVVGARSVKWLHRIIISTKESSSHWQQNDYKMVPPVLKDYNNINFSNYKAIMESPVQSAICEPLDSTLIDSNAQDTFTVKGYAFSGGGNSINSNLNSFFLFILVLFNFNTI
jgi:sulfite oxidase